MKHIIQFSGGAASYVTAKLVLAENDPSDVVLLFADTLIEDEDLYRFNRDVERRLNLPITRICEGRTPWQVFFDEGMMGNTRADPCSRILKREPLRKWLFDNCDPADTVAYIGFDANEEHRLERALPHWAPWRLRAPLVEKALFKEFVLQIVEEDGLQLPRLYKWGFPHNNCGGFCIKQGHGGFALLHEFLPGRYFGHAREEQRFRAETGKDVAILRDRRGGKTRPLTLLDLARRIEADPSQIDRFDLGGCACMEPSASDSGTSDHFRPAAKKVSSEKRDTGE